MNLNISNLINHSINTFRAQAISPLQANLQMRVLAIALIILGCLATCLYFCTTTLSSTVKKSVKLSKTETNDPSSPERGNLKSEILDEKIDSQKFDNQAKGYQVTEEIDKCDKTGQEDVNSDRESDLDQPLLNSQKGFKEQLTQALETKSKIPDKIEQPLIPNFQGQNETDTSLPPIIEVDYKTIFNKLGSETSDPTYLPYKELSCQFSDILCPKDTRVNLPENTEEIYLHANHVNLEGVHYILSQYPTIWQFSLFWKTCKDACLVLDLTNAKDMKSGLLPYAPTLTLPLICRNLNVKCIKQHSLDNTKASLYTYHIQENRGGNDEFEIPRLHFEGWDDYQGITEDDLDQIIAIFVQYQKDPTQPIIIHCRAGVGRSGTLTVAYALYFLIKEKKVNFHNLMDHIGRLILEGRAQRGFGFVQNPRQLEAIFKWGWRALHRAKIS